MKIAFVEEYRAALKVAVVEEYRADLLVAVVEEYRADALVAQVEEYRAQTKVAIVPEYRAGAGAGASHGAHGGYVGGKGSIVDDISLRGVLLFLIGLFAINVGPGQGVADRLGYNWWYVLGIPCTAFIVVVVAGVLAARAKVGWWYVVGLVVGIAVGFWLLAINYRVGKLYATFSMWPHIMGATGGAGAAAIGWAVTGWRQVGNGAAKRLWLLATIVVVALAADLAIAGLVAVT